MVPTLAYTRSDKADLSAADIGTVKVRCGSSITTTDGPVTGDVNCNQGYPSDGLANNVMNDHVLSHAAAATQCRVMSSVVRGEGRIQQQSHIYSSRESVMVEPLKRPVFTRQEMKTLLDLVEVKLPVSSSNWAEIAWALYMLHPTAMRCGEACRRKFLSICNSS